jgi:predicted nuclease of predicted toxin-antitoxin system
VTSVVRGGVPEHPGIPTALKTQPLRPIWTRLNWQPSGSIPVSATKSSRLYGSTPVLEASVDENLAPSLAKDLAGLFPLSVHVGSVELGSTADALVWQYAKEHGFTFLTKDKDFANLGLAWGAPPKVILLQTGNCSTARIEAIVRANAIRLAHFRSDARQRADSEVMRSA